MKDWKVTARDLVYAAHARCPCGAGLAYVPAWYDKPDSPAYRCWDCSAILLGAAVPKDVAGSVQHTGKLPFIFYEILSEKQPSAQGATTRPRGETPTPVIEVR
jgi:hypothetical protein